MYRSPCYFLKLMIHSICARNLLNLHTFMPNTTSAKKALRQSKKKNLINTRAKNSYKKAIKETVGFIGENNKEKAKEMLRIAIKKIDKAAKKKVLKKNTASRKKSRLARAINKIKG